VNLALLVKKGEMGLPSVLTAKTWGFYDVLFKVCIMSYWGWSWAIFLTRDFLTES